MLPTQIEDEVKNVMKLVDEVYKTFGLTYTVELSTMPENHIGELSEWELAETALANALKHMGLEYKINAGDGAFYGPNRYSCQRLHRKRMAMRNYSTRYAIAKEI